MLYNYYMKKWLCGLCALVLSLPVFAQLSVVRIDGNKVYLDISDEKTAPVKGSTFKVIVSSETLTNPQTGKNLGLMYKYSDIGTITEVQPLYAVGELKNITGVTVGKQAVWEEVSAPVAAPAKENQTPLNIRKKVTYQPLEQNIISVTQADVTAPQAQNIVTLADNNQIMVYARGEKETLQPRVSFELPSGKKGLAISAAPVKEGLAQIFVAVFDARRNQISTLVLENTNGQLTHIATLPFYVKELGCGKDKKIWAQRPFVLGNTPGNAREIVFEKGKYVASAATFNTKHNWLEGLNLYPVETAGENNLIATAANGRLRLSLNNGKTAESKDLFGSTPLRVQYKQEILKFYPSVQVFGQPGRATLAAVENGTKLGLLSETFGQYQAGKVHFLTYEKGRLQITDTTELDGVLYDTACTDTAILTAEVLPNGTSTVVEILK